MTRTSIRVLPSAVAVLVLVLGGVAACAATPPHAATVADVGERRDAAERLRAATSVVEGQRSDPDRAIPHAIAKSAKCVSVVPSMLHAGLLLGVHRGRGVVTCRSGEDWATPSFVRVSGSGAGLLAGVESVDLVMLLMNDESARSLAGARVQFGAAGSIAAGPVGRQWQATPEPGLGASLLCYSSSRGLFAGISLTEVVIETDDEAARAFYGDARDFGVLLRGTTALPPEVAPFLTAMRNVF